MFALDTARATAYTPALNATALRRLLVFRDRDNDGSAIEVTLIEEGSHELVHAPMLDPEMRFWLGAAERLVTFWDNDVDAQYDAL